MPITTLLTCAAFMALVAVISYLKARGAVSDASGYFLAGRGLSGTFIAGSLLLTNLSAEHLIGLNGNAYRGNMSGMAWEVTAAAAIIIMATYLLPRYLAGGFTTLPEYLGQRYDQGVRRLMVLLFMSGYVLVTIPATLYSGALAILKLFDIPALFNLTFAQSVWALVWVIGAIGAAYAVFGGLKAVAVSDTLNGVGLVVVGLLVPMFGFYALGGGDLIAGMKTIALEHSEKLDAIGSATDSVPFGTIFTGMVFANLFYWGTNQYVIQRTLGAGSLSEGQKGVLASGFYKIAVPLVMMLPGVIAFHLYGGELDPVDLAYPQLVSGVLPTALSGLFLAVLLGAVFSTFNSLLHSAATMFALDIYRPKLNPDASEAQVVCTSKRFGTLIAVVSCGISPFLMYAPDGIFDIIRKFTGFFNIPTIVLVAVGLLSRRVPAAAAKVVVVFHLAAYYMLVWGQHSLFGSPVVEINFIHVYFVLFWVEVLIMVAIGRLQPSASAAPVLAGSPVALAPWRGALLVLVLLLAAVVFVYLLFSRVGLACPDAVVSAGFAPAVALLLLATVTIGTLAHTKGFRWYAARVSGAAALAPR